MTGIALLASLAALLLGVMLLIPEDLTGSRNHYHKPTPYVFRLLCQFENGTGNLLGHRWASHVSGSSAQVWSGVRGGAMLITPNTNSFPTGCPASANTSNLLPSAGL